VKALDFESSELDGLSFIIWLLTSNVRSMSFRHVTQTAQMDWVKQCNEYLKLNECLKPSFNRIEKLNVSCPKRIRDVPLYGQYLVMLSRIFPKAIISDH